MMTTMMMAVVVELVENKSDWKLVYENPFNHSLLCALAVCVCICVLITDDLFAEMKKKCTIHKSLTEVEGNLLNEINYYNRGCKCSTRVLATRFLSQCFFVNYFTSAI